MFMMESMPTVWASLPIHAPITTSFLPKVSRMNRLISPGSMASYAVSCTWIVETSTDSRVRPYTTK